MARRNRRFEDSAWRPGLQRAQDGPAHTVAESPNAPFCSVNATAYRKKQMAKARDKVRVCTHARIVGVVFWDRPHNVTGRAPNSIELHPILDFACLSG